MRRTPTTFQKGRYFYTSAWSESDSVAYGISSEIPLSCLHYFFSVFVDDLQTLDSGFSFFADDYKNILVEGEAFVKLYHHPPDSNSQKNLLLFSAFVDDLIVRFIPQVSFRTTRKSASLPAFLKFAILQVVWIPSCKFRIFFFELLHYLFSVFVHDLQTQDLHPFTTGNQTISIFGGDFRVMQTDSEFVRNPSVSCLLLHYLFVLVLCDDLQIQVFSHVSIQPEFTHRRWQF